MDILSPRTPDELSDALRWAVASERALAVTAGCSKLGWGRPVTEDVQLDVGGLSGVTLYQPEELVLTAQAGTPIAEIDCLLLGRNQHLAFEPPDFGPLLGTGARLGTLGGAVACNLGGPRRPMAGAARDHVLGFKAVSGRGEAFKSGGRVVKNVTGFDLSKLMAGSFGTLAVLSEVTVKVLPRPEVDVTLVLAGLEEAPAVAAMTTALSGPFSPTGVAHLPADVAEGDVATTLFRLEGPEPSVAERAAALEAAFRAVGTLGRVEDEVSGVLWRRIRDVAFFTGADESDQLWRLSVAPAEAVRVGGALRAMTGGRLYYDWGGGLIWFAMPPRDDAAHEAVRAALGDTGQATLIRAAPEVRAAVPVFQPQPAPLAALTRRVKQGFDPKHILNPGRLAADL